jgi:predicted transcriptional regulator of viral defense system
MEHTNKMKNKLYHMQTALELAKKSKILRSNDLARKGIPRIILTRLIANGQLEKIGRGLYCLPGTEFSEKESLLTIAIKLPNAVFCLLSALQIHNLTTQLPRQVWIAMPHGSHLPKIDYPPLKMLQYSGLAYSEGIQTIEYDKVIMRVYNPAKTVADCFKHRSKIGLDVAIEALKEVRRKQKASVEELWHFAKICRVANIMRPYLEAIE